MSISPILKVTFYSDSKDAEIKTHIGNDILVKYGGNAKFDIPPNTKSVSITLFEYRQI